MSLSMKRTQFLISASIALIFGAASACSKDIQPSTSTGTTGEVPSSTGKQTSSSSSGATTQDSTATTEATTGSIPSTNGGSTSGESPGTDEVPKACSEFPEHFCTQPMDCSKADCGPTSAFSEEGCLRSRCKSDSDCGPEEGCDLESFSSTWSCSDDDNDECACVVLDDIDGGYCVPR